MRKPRDIQAELHALREKEAQLKAAHRAQLAELLARTGADRLDLELLAGALLDVVDKAEGAAGEAWRQRGEAFFRPARRDRERAGAAAPTAAGTDGAGAAVGAGQPA
jgi:hypothetical protein